MNPSLLRYHHKEINNNPTNRTYILIYTVKDKKYCLKNSPAGMEATTQEEYLLCHAYFRIKKAKYLRTVCSVLKSH